MQQPAWIIYNDSRRLFVVANGATGFKLTAGSVSGRQKRIGLFDTHRRPDRR